MNLALRVAQRGDADYAGWCPDLPGCGERGATRQEAVAKTAETAAGYLASLNIALPREFEDAFIVESGTEQERGADQ